MVLLTAVTVYLSNTAITLYKDANVARLTLEATRRDVVKLTHELLQAKEAAADLRAALQTAEVKLSIKGLLPQGQTQTATANDVDTERYEIPAALHTILGDLEDEY